jgi:WD40 repeat protein
MGLDTATREASVKGQQDGEIHNMLVSGSRDQTVRVWDFQREPMLHDRGRLYRQVWSRHRAPVMCVAFAPGDRNYAHETGDSFLPLQDANFMVCCPYYFLEICDCWRRKSGALRQFHL